MFALQNALSKCGFNHPELVLLTLNENWIYSKFASKEIKILALRRAKVEKLWLNSNDILDKKLLCIEFELLEMLLEKLIKDHIKK